MTDRHGRAFFHSMIGILTRRELLSNLLTFRLAAAVSFAVVLAALTTFIGSLDYSRNITAVEAERRAIRGSLEKVTVYQNLVPRFVIPPDPLSILSRGVLRTSGRSLYIEIGRKQIASWPISTGIDNEFMKALAQVDFTTVVAILLSFLAVVLGFDGICGERERGTLRQVLANPVPRASLVLGKLLGGSLSLWTALALAYAISLLILLANPDIHLGGEQWLRLAILFGLSCLFLSTVFAVALWVSSCTRDSDTSLVICLFGWLVLGVGWMNLLPSAGRYLVHEIPYEDFVAERDRLAERFDDEMASWEEAHPSPGPAYVKGFEVDGVLRYAHPEGYAWLQQRHAYAVGRLLERAGALYQARYANQQPLIEQSGFVDTGSLLSPLTNYHMLCSRLAGTTLGISLHMGAVSRHYRETFIQWLRGRDAFGSRRWFSDDPPDQAPMIADPAAVTPDMLAADSAFMQQRLAWVQTQESLATHDDRRHLDLSDMPDMPADVRPGLPQVLEDMTAGLAILCATFAAAVGATFWRVATYDPTI